MILKRIEADNILRYRKLRLHDLPAHGQLAVAGPNEAGKTAIGETICFGLFGRTFSLGPNELDKVMQNDTYYGMQSFNQALLRLVKNGVVTEDEALATSSTPEDL